MSRTRIELESNDNITNEKIIREILKSSRYHEEVKPEETYWKCGIGIVTAPKFIKYTFQENTLILEGWIRPMIFAPEHDLDSGLEKIARRSCKKVLEKITSKINTSSK